MIENHFIHSMWSWSIYSWWWYMWCRSCHLGMWWVWWRRLYRYVSRLIYLWKSWFHGILKDMYIFENPEKTELVHYFVKSTNKCFYWCTLQTFENFFVVLQISWNIMTQNQLWHFTTFQFFRQFELQSKFVKHVNFTEKNIVDGKRLAKYYTVRCLTWKIFRENGFLTDFVLFTCIDFT